MSDENEPDQPTESAVREVGSFRRRHPSTRLMMWILDHQRWLRTEGKFGRQLDIFGQLDGKRLDVKSIDLDGFDLSKAILENVTFRWTSMRGTKFSETEQKDVIYSDCDVEGADFTGAKLQNVSFRESNTHLAHFDSNADDVVRESEPSKLNQRRNQPLSKLER